MNELTEALELISGGNPDAIRRKVADYEAARKAGTPEPRVTVKAREWAGDDLAFALKLLADLKAEIIAGADNEELREYAESYVFRMTHVFDVLRLLV